MMIVKAVIRDSSISDHARWKDSNERVQTSLSMEQSMLRRVSAWSLKFTADNYWSSSEYSSTNSWNQNFNNGNQNNNNKNNTNYVRAVR